MEQTVNSIISKDLLSWLIVGATLLVPFWLKYTSKNDIYASIRKEDFAFGLDFIATSLIVTLTSAYKTNSASPLWFLVAIFVVISVVPQIIRKGGWRSETEMTWVLGVILPNLIGLGLLYLSVYHFG